MVVVFWKIGEKEMNIIQNTRDNIYKEMRKKQIKLDDFCKSTGFSREDVARIILGDALLAPWQVEIIADTLGTTKNKLMYGRFWRIKIKKLQRKGRWYR
ncbi:MAG: hypothetical protein RRY99_10715 [Flavobacterium sp.]